MSQMIDGFGLRCPDRAEALVSLRRVLGADEATASWRRACAATGVVDQGLSLETAELLRVAEHLSQCGGLEGVAGNSLWIRLQTWQLLARRQRARATKGTPT